MEQIRSGGTSGAAPTPDEQEAMDIAAAIEASKALADHSEPPPPYHSPPREHTKSGGNGKGNSSTGSSSTHTAGQNGTRRSRRPNSAPLPGAQGNSEHLSAVAAGSNHTSTGSHVQPSTSQRRPSSSGANPSHRASVSAGSTPSGATGGGGPVNSRQITGTSSKRGSRTPSPNASAAAAGGGRGATGSSTPFTPLERAMPTTSGGGSGGGGSSAAAAAAAAAAGSNGVSGASGAQQGARPGEHADVGGAQAESAPPGWSWQGLQKSIFGVLLGAGGVEGAAEAAGKTVAKGGVKPARELTPHIMQVTAGGKYSVVVWRKNKQVRLLAECRTIPRSR